MIGSTVSSSAQADPSRDFSLERTVRVADGVLGYRECGSGPATVVLLHGISSGSGSWSDCAAILAKRARVIAWDAPGYGASTPLASSTPTAPDYAECIDALIEALQVEQCLLVGHSLGALMAAAYGSRAGHRAAGFLLISPALGYGGDTNPQSMQVRQRRLDALRELGIEGMAAKLPERLLSAQAGDAAREVVQRNALRLHANGYAQAVELLCGDDINRYVLPDGATGVACGAYDIVTTPDQSRNFAHQQGIPFTLIPDAAHACYVEQPGSVAAYILNALNNLDVSEEHE